MPYQSQWPLDFLSLKTQLQTVFGSLAKHIDHIGSTAVPGLAAKDIIDIQVSVTDLEDSALQALLNQLEASSAYRVHRHFRDELTGLAEESPELKKYFMATQPPQRAANIHIRQMGKRNHRYALLFCAFLKENPAEAHIYGLLKQRFAAFFPESIEGYLYFKDPLMDLLYLQAERWATQTAWQAHHA